MKNVLLKERKLPAGKTPELLKVSFYIQYFQNGDRIRESLDLAPVVKYKKSKTGKPSATKEYKETKKLAEILKSRRHEDLLQHKVKLNLREDTTKLFPYLHQYRKNYKKKDSRKVDAMLNYLKEFTKDIRLIQVDRRFVIDFRDYLLQHLKPDAARNYLAILKKALDRAVVDGIIQFNISRGRNYSSKRN